MENSFDLDDFIRFALAEDIGDGDHTTLSTIPTDTQGKAKLLVKENGIIAGVDIAQRVAEIVDPRLQFEKIISDGAPIQKGDIAFYLSGSSQSITTAERLILNIMQRMSGIATKTHRIQSLIAETHCKLLDTRKTTPGFRYFEKLAVKIGGGVNHRFGLYDMILVKDNHVDFCGGVVPALEHVKNYLQKTGKNLRVEVEARNLSEVEQILSANIAFRILLDNFQPDSLREAVKFIQGRVQTEASGGINENNVMEYARTGVDYISMGALTHQVQSLDLSLKAMNI
ncbi:MAG: carboxylating nicotinate-nucleotide diphosphorylase [Flavobacteriales bacterium]|nr:carboxylating nicotinate-nucleotide diphosphorylase [Flavobacteriales bacterium]